MFVVDCLRIYNIMYACTNNYKYLPICISYYGLDLVIDHDKDDQSYYYCCLIFDDECLSMTQLGNVHQGQYRSILSCHLYIINNNIVQVCGHWSH